MHFTKNIANFRTQMYLVSEAHTKVHATKMSAHYQRYYFKRRLGTTKMDFHQKTRNDVLR